MPVSNNSLILICFIRWVRGQSSISSLIFSLPLHSLTLRQATCWKHFQCFGRLMSGGDHLPPGDPHARSLFNNKKNLSTHHGNLNVNFVILNFYTASLAILNYIAFFLLKKGLHLITSSAWCKPIMCLMVLRLLIFSFEYIWSLLSFIFPLPISYSTILY